MLLFFFYKVSYNLYKRIYYLIESEFIKGEFMNKLKEDTRSIITTSIKRYSSRS